jgi:pyrroline-5-carboxylate reductase
MNENNTIAFVGCGNLLSSIVSGLIETGYPKEKLWATNRSAQRVNFFKEHAGINATDDNIEAVRQADVVVLGVKPQQMQAVVKQVAPIIKENKPLVISVAVGVSVALIEKWLGGSAAIVRSMPNTPALIGAGAAGLYANNMVSGEQKTIAESIHRAVGLALWVKEETLIDAVAAVSGSGPAYFFYVIEAMQQAGQQLGLTESDANLLALQTAVGAGRLALESEDDVVVLRKKVTSPKGTTEQAINVFEQENLKEIFAKAMQATTERAKILTRLLDEN